MPLFFSNIIHRLLPWMASKKHYWCWSLEACKNTDGFLKNELCCIISITILPTALPTVRQVGNAPVSMLRLVKGLWLHVTSSPMWNVTYTRLHVLSLHLTFIDIPEGALGFVSVRSFFCLQNLYTSPPRKATRINILSLIWWWWVKLFIKDKVSLIEKKISLKI